MKSRRLMGTSENGTGTDRMPLNLEEKWNSIGAGPVLRGSLMLVAILTCGLQTVNAATWAIVVGVDRYTKLNRENDLKFCGADAQLFAQTLVESNNLRNDSLLHVFVQRAAGKERPSLSTLKKRIPEILSKVGKHDDVIFFYSGHGFLGNDGKSYLAPQDCDPLRLAQTAISIRWLRDQLEQCSANRRIVFLDACYVGNANAWTTVAGGVNRSAIQRFFEDRPATYSIVSCDRDQMSLEWPAKRHGVFTYWLTRGMEGAADADGDASVSLDELFSFVRANVSETARMLAQSSVKSFEQQPVRFMAGNKLGVPQLGLRAEAASLALERLAELVDDLLRHQRAKGLLGRQVGILEFANHTGNELVLRGSLGSLGLLVAQRIEARLHELSVDGAYAIRNRDETTNLLAQLDQPFGVKDLHNRNRILELSSQDNSPDILLAGTMRRLAKPDRLVITTRLIQLQSGKTLGQATVTLVVDADLWPLLGNSVDLSSIPRRNDPGTKPNRQTRLQDNTPNSVQPSPLAVPEIVNDLNRHSDRPHPQLPGGDEPCVKLVVYRLRNGRREVAPLETIQGYDGQQVGFSLRKNDEFDLELSNVHKNSERLAAVVLVDGLNVLSPIHTQPTNATQRPETFEFVKEARSWLLPPKSVLKIDGWLWPRESASSERLEFDRYKFRVVDLADSLAGQSGFHDQVGQITVAVFGTREIPRGARAAGRGPIGIGAGELGSRDFPIIRDWTINRRDLKAVYTVRYYQDQ